MQYVREDAMCVGHASKVVYIYIYIMSYTVMYGWMGCMGYECTWYGVVGFDEIQVITMMEEDGRGSRPSARE